MRPVLPALAVLVVACSDNGPIDPPGPPDSLDPAPVASVTLEPVTMTLVLGQWARIVVVLRDTEGNVLTDRLILFTSSNSTVARVDPSGVVEALAEGTATITAISEGKSGRMTVMTITAGGDPCLGCWDYTPSP